MSVCVQCSVGIADRQMKDVRSALQAEIKTIEVRPERTRRPTFSDRSTKDVEQVNST